MRWGAGPRAGQSLILGAKAHALLAGRFAVAPDDIQRVALPVLRHRVLPNFAAEAEGVSVGADHRRDHQWSRLRVRLRAACELTSRPGSETSLMAVDPILDSRLLDAVRGVRWPSRRKAPGGLAGTHLSRAGMSAEFTEYRPIGRATTPVASTGVCSRAAIGRTSAWPTTGP